MPAPTALLKPIAAPEDVPLPDQDDGELHIEATAEIPAEPDLVLQPVANEDVEMVEDEEGRPSFPRGADTVISLHRPYPAHATTDISPSLHVALRCEKFQYHRTESRR
jgi:hypothetical protein